MTVRPALALLAILAAAASVLPAAAEKPVAIPPPPPHGEPYRIGPGDVLRVIVWGEEGLDLVLRVRPDGQITFPMVHDIAAAGLTPADLGTAIARRLADYVRHPDVAVIVQEINSIRIHVLGEVNAQGSFSFDHRPTLLEVLATAGGTTPLARGRVLVIRHGPVGDRRFELDLDRILTTKNGAALDPRLEPGDILVVR